jgi:predicted PurR-regulated permease PerM
MSQPLSGARKASYALGAVLLLVTARFDLGHALIAGLFTHMLLTQTQDALLRSGSSPRMARWTSVGLFAVIGLLLAVIFTTFLKIGMSRLPMFLDRVLPRVDEITNRFGFDLPVDNVQELRALILTSMRENERSIASTSGLLTRGFFQIILAIIVAALQFLTPASGAGPARQGLDAELMRECGARAALFSHSFERVMGAQIMIAGINAGMAGVFMFALRIPFRTMLTLAAFVFGLFPIVGNLVSNSLIVASALTVSERMAVAALVFLVVVHKGGYFLYGRIVGARIEIPTWAILAGLLAGEAMMGVTGVILAPTLIFYVREELRAVPAR